MFRRQPSGKTIVKPAQADILRDTDPAACQETPGIDRADILGKKERGRPFFSPQRPEQVAKGGFCQYIAAHAALCRCPDKCLHPLGRVKNAPRRRKASREGDMAMPQLAKMVYQQRQAVIIIGQDAAAVR